MVSLFFVVIPVSAQTIETLTYFNLSQNRNVTVRVMHVAWEQHYITVSNAGTRNARLLTYASSAFTPEAAARTGTTSEWSQWELIGTEPSSFADADQLVLERNVLMENYVKRPISGMQIHMQFGDVVRISVPPNNRGTPFWFDQSNNLNIFFKLYMIIP
jgi:hypothetical protein